MKKDGLEEKEQVVEEENQQIQIQTNDLKMLCESDNINDPAAQEFILALKEWVINTWNSHIWLSFSPFYIIGSFFDIIAIPNFYSASSSSVSLVVFYLFSLSAWLGEWNGFLARIWDCFHWKNSRKHFNKKHKANVFSSQEQGNLFHYKSETRFKTTVVRPIQKIK